MPARATGLRDPRVLRVALLYVLARIPAAAIWLSVVLDVSAASGSYGRAGGAVAAYGIGVAAIAPLVGRMADRHGARCVLLTCTAVQFPALLLLSATADSAGLTLLVPALLAGAAQPPLVPCMRAAWKVLVPDPEDRRPCLAFDAVLGEVVDLGAPLIAVAVNLAAGGPGSLPVVAVAAAVAMCAFTVVVPATPPQRVHEPVVLAITKPVLAVLGLILIITSALGAVEVGAIAVADAAGQRKAAGALLAVFAAASILGGVLNARRSSTVRPTGELVALQALLCGGLAVAAVASDDLWVTGAFLALAGLAVAPLVTVLLGLVEAVARLGAETLTFTFATTANFLGVAAGSTLAGLAVDRSVGEVLDEGTSGLLVGAALAGLSLGVLALVRRSLPTGPVVLRSPLDVADDEPSNEELVDELEALWRQTRELGARNDELARTLAGVRSSRSG